MCTTTPAIQIFLQNGWVAARAVLHEFPIIFFFKLKKKKKKKVFLKMKVLVLNIARQWIGGFEEKNMAVSYLCGDYNWCEYDPLWMIGAFTKILLVGIPMVKKMSSCGTRAQIIFLR